MTLKSIDDCSETALTLSTSHFGGVIIMQCKNPSNMIEVEKY